MASFQRVVEFALVIVCVVDLQLGQVAYAGYELPTRLKPDLFCPARVSFVVPVHRRAVATDWNVLGADDEFGVVLEADAQKEISGTIDVLTGNVVYSFPIPRQALHEAQRQWTMNGKPAAVWTLYVSKPMYFKLPSVASVSAVWLADANVNGAPLSCASLPLVKRQALYTPGLQQRAFFAGSMPEQVIASAPPQATRVTRLRELDMADCTAVFREGRMVLGALPMYPPGAQGATGEAVILLALDSAGHVADASVLVSSGNEALDAAGLLEASKSTFAPPEFLCVPVPGFYTFIARFGA